MAPRWWGHTRWCRGTRGRLDITHAVSGVLDDVPERVGTSSSVREARGGQEDMQQVGDHGWACQQSRAAWSLPGQCR